jgi:Leucine-rich repeat (LRR) protein
MRFLKFAAASLSALVLVGCNQSNAPEKPAPGEQRLSDEETTKLWDEQKGVADTLRRELGDTVMVCRNLPPEACLWVGFSGKPITDAGLESLGRASRIGELHLDGTAITDAGLKHLKGLTRLMFLDLSDTQVTDAGLEHLTGLAELRTLYLDGTRVTGEGVKKLQQSLPKCEIDGKVPEDRR